jgi:hypothetical protein
MEFHYDDPRQGETLYKFCDEQAVEVLITQQSCTIQELFAFTILMN